MTAYLYQNASGERVVRNFKLGEAPAEIVEGAVRWRKVIEAPAGVHVQGGTGAAKVSR